MQPPTLTFRPLPHPQTQGSAQLAHAGYTILASANGPIEAVRREQQNPEETSLEINFRPAAGGGGPKDRHIERTLHATLKPLLDRRAHPRCLVQVTLQVLATPADKESSAPSQQWEGTVTMLPALVNVSVCALLDAGVPMRGVAVSVGLATYREDADDSDEESDVEMDDSERAGLVVLDSAKTLDEARKLSDGIHAFAFNGKGEMVLAVSEGCCSLEAWEQAGRVAESMCCGAKDEGEGMIGWLRSQLGDELAERRRWKGDGKEG